MQLTFLDSTQPDWNEQVARLWQRLAVDQRATLFPDYFLQSTLPRLGGRIALYHAGESEIGAGLLFPRQLDPNGTPTFTLRYHPFDHQPWPERAALAAITRGALGGADVVIYNPADAHTFAPSAHHFGQVEIGQPSAAEAAQIPQLQQQVWGSDPAECYPVDLHSVAFAPGTSLVARVNGQLAGFLIGFAKFGGYPLPGDWQDRFVGGWRLESQIMGVLPEFRGLRIANLLKRQQASEAAARGVKLINWTADPLQYANAALNFGLLRAVAFDFTPNYYAFRNQLNRVPAARFSLTWLINTARVQQALQTAQSIVLDLSQHPAIVRINDGWQVIAEPGSASQIAIEIPADWTALQRDQPDAAIQWRAVTDEIFGRWIGLGDGQYVITGVGVAGERRYLVGERATATLWQRLGE